MGVVLHWMPLVHMNLDRVHTVEVLHFTSWVPSGGPALWPFVPGGFHELIGAGGREKTFAIPTAHGWVPWA